MIKFYIAAAVSMVLPAVASAEELPQHHFTSQGVDYDYTVKTKGDVRILIGAADHGRTPFELHVSKTGVDGYFGDSSVSFSMAEVRRSGGALVAMAT